MALIAVSSIYFYCCHCCIGLWVELGTLKSLPSREEKKRDFGKSPRLKYFSVIFTHVLLCILGLTLEVCMSSSVSYLKGKSDHTHDRTATFRH